VGDSKGNIVGDRPWKQQSHQDFLGRWGGKEKGGIVMVGSKGNRKSKVRQRESGADGFSKGGGGGGKKLGMGKWGVPTSTLNKGD